jgi:hypothetical protein
VDFHKVTFRPTWQERDFLEEVGNRIGATSVTETLHTVLENAMRYGDAGVGDPAEKRRRMTTRSVPKDTDDRTKSNQSPRSFDANSQELQGMVANLQWMLSQAVQTVNSQQQQISYLEQQLTMQMMSVQQQHWPISLPSSKETDTVDWMVDYAEKMLNFKKGLQALRGY